MSQSGPRNISIGNLIRYHFPLTAIVSILHRISGVILFLFIPFALWVLTLTLRSPGSYYQVQQVMNQGWIKFLLWICFSALIYHAIAGIKHIMMDMGYLEEKQSSTISSSIVLVLSIICVVLLGVWLW